MEDDNIEDKEEKNTMKDRT